MHLILPLLVLPLLAVPLRAAGQTQIGNQLQQAPNRAAPPPLGPMPHLYWQLLNNQYHLDEAAADREKQGKEGQALRTALQRQTGLSDTDFSPVRDTADRLGAELEPVDTQVRQILARYQTSPRNASLPLAASSSDKDQFASLAKQRQTYIDNEVGALLQELSPQNKAALDAFLQRFFAARNAVPKPSSSVAAPVAKGVQQ